MDQGRIKPIDSVKQVVTQAKRDDLNGLSAELAYRFFLALFPFFIFVGALAGFIAQALSIQNPTEQIVGLLGESLPAGANDLVREQFQAVVGEQHPGLLSFGIIGSVLVATGGVMAIMKGMNMAYDVEETRPFWRRFLTALWLMVLGSAGVLGAFFLLVGGELFGRQMASASGLTGAYETAVNLIRWPLVVFLLLLATTFLYRHAPNVELPLRLVTPGALVFAVGWVLATYLFTLYVANFGSYANTYGALASVAILLIWFYISAFVLLLGAEVNAVLDKQAQPREWEVRRRQAEEDGREEHRRVTQAARDTLRKSA